MIHIIASFFCCFSIDSEIILSLGEKNQFLIWASRFEICFRLFNIEGLELTIKPKIQAYDPFYLELLLLSTCIDWCTQTYWFLLSRSFDQGKSQ